MYTLASQERGSASGQEGQGLYLNLVPFSYIPDVHNIL
ncbi:hypothetical protein GXM_06244 [Nostoc sphaeroides CCNUC1]|uniref:Uncharacterized protein n=1 Tax=Nostoc sphaeroides CCNUC1 TaxID=2653204 RepID=A0A5P8W7X2_9NOSO|nr:hypothetical protein GXM_06244 [Nostoc sphaeroides CCNUC1]